MSIQQLEREPRTASGYRMISAFRARDFRAFESLELSGLRRLNIVVGASASGKTALLEGLRLALGGTPLVAYTIAASRGVPVFVPQNPTNQQFEAAWNPLFFDFDGTREIALEIIDSSENRASVKIFYDIGRASTQITPQLPGIQAVPSVATTIVPLAFKRRHFNGDENTLYGTLNPQGNFHLEQGREIGQAAEFFPSTWQSNSVQVAGWFSQLSVNNKEKMVVAAIMREFREIIDLSVEVPNQLPIVYATMRHRSRKLPIAFVSAGISKFMSLLVAIKNYSPGVVLIDEIENGIYYKMFPSLWAALRRFAIDSDTQLFLSTHSWECLTAAADLIGDHSEDFSVIQVYQEDGYSHATVVPGEDAAAAIAGGLEIRKA